MVERDFPIQILLYSTPVCGSKTILDQGGSRNLGRGGTGRGWVREGDVPSPARSAEALSNIAILTHIHNVALIT